MMYQISCLRSPCVDTLDLKRPTKYPDDPQQDPPAIYIGETSRSCYIRGLKHLSDYRAKESKCSLWRHTRATHGGVIGPQRELGDYKMVKLREWPKPLDRETGEGYFIHQMELRQSQSKAICLNSKEDFKQSSTVTIQYNTGSTNC